MYEERFVTTVRSLHHAHIVPNSVIDLQGYEREFQQPGSILTRITQKHEIPWIHGDNKKSCLEAGGVRWPLF